jgi:hypothetical protein
VVEFYDRSLTLGLDVLANRSTDELTLDAAAVVAEEAVERKEARRVKPWLSELDIPEWQELAGDRLGWGKMLKSIKIRT